MSISSALVAAQGRVADAYTAISNKGGTLPATQNLANMPTAINSIPTGGSPTLITKTITANGTYNASSDNADGYSSVTVNVSGGSKYGCTIDNFLGNKDANNKLLPPENISLDLSGVEDIEQRALYYRFFSMNINSLNLSDIKSLSGNEAMNRAFAYGIFPQNYNIDMSKLEEISGASALQSAFLYTNIESVDLSSLIEVSGTRACSETFSSIQGLLTVDLRSLKRVTGSNGCYYMFNTCKNLALGSLPELEEVSGLNGMSNFLGFTAADTTTAITSFYFNKLKILTGDRALYRFFRNRKMLQHIYFNALETTSFRQTYTNQLEEIIGKIEGCTMHFPSNMQNTIATLTGYPNFGGTNTVLAFDLPATS